MIGEQKTNGDFLAKEGSLGAARAGESSAIQSIALASDPTNGPLIGELNTKRRILCQAGSLGAAWTLEGGENQAIALAG